MCAAQSPPQGGSGGLVQDGGGGEGRGEVSEGGAGSLVLRLAKLWKIGFLGGGRSVEVEVECTFASGFHVATFCCVEAVQIGDGGVVLDLGIEGTHLRY